MFSKEETQHTSCGLTINENADPYVRTALDNILDHLVPERQPYYEHILEGDDDMPAYAKSTLTGVSQTIPITNNRLNLGTWQEFIFVSSVIMVVIAQSSSLSTPD